MRCSPSKRKIRPLVQGCFSLVEKSVAAYYLTPRRLLAKTRVRNRKFAKAGRNSLAWIPRKWATDRRHFPLKDVATAGGWSDVQTMITCYQQPDAEMIRAVVDLAKTPDPARTVA